MKPSICALGDLHLPFVHRKLMSWALSLIAKIQPTDIVIMGDVYDLYSFSKFGQRIAIRPKDEIEAGREQYEEILGYLKKSCPKSKIHVIRGNHDARGLARMYEQFGAAWESIMEPKDLWRFPGVNVVMDTKEVLELYGIAFTHGHRKFGTHLPNMGFRSTVIGHLHHADIKWFRKDDGEMVFEACTGLMGDPFHEALNYRPLNKYFNWHHGLFYYDSYGPRFIPYTEEKKKA